MSDLISRSDAIGAVKEERFPIDSDYAEGFMAALDKVEWILKEWLPSAQPDSKETSSTHKALDTISRQAALNALSRGSGCGASCHRAIKALPSAQPEIIRCNSCKYWTQSTGEMKGYGLGRCDFHDADLVAYNGFCYWAERRTDEGD